METAVKNTVNKAEEKRIRDAKQSITNLLNSKLIDFKERYLKSYVDYKFNEFDLQIKSAEKQVYNKEDIKYHYTLEMFQRDIQSKIARIKAEQALTYTNLSKFLKEAEEGYNVKFERLVDTLVKSGIRSYPLTIEKIQGGTEFDFSFLVSHTTTEKSIQVYARIIFACGAINAPHYRFIITANKNLKH